ncbi:MAG TPA: hypothetical protein VGP72_24820 [Planctomycetota bacterium]|jgi:histidinol phosphatase-like PHP family hydrolase
MSQQLSRRGFLAGAAGVAGALSVGNLSAADKEAPVPTIPGTDIPLVDFHVHRDNTTLEKLLEISAAKATKFGIVEHAGNKELKYPIIYSNDEELKAYITSLEGKPVYKGIQAEYIDWMKCFSKDVIAQLDYVLSDAMTFREKDGHYVMLWKDDQVKIDNAQDFMDRYTDFNVEVIASEPLDIFANPTYLPKAIEKDYDTLWTDARMRKIVDAAVKYGVAIELSTSRLPRLAFLKMAKAAGAKFSFGSNIRGPNVGKLDYAIEMVKELGLKKEDIFTPQPPGKKPIQVRK